MPIYNLLEYSSNCSDTTGILWFYSIDKANNFNFNRNRGSIHTNGILKNATNAVPLKYHLSNFWRSLEMPLIHWNV